MIRDFYGLFRQLYKVIINNTISQSIYTKKNRSNQKNITAPQKPQSGGTALTPCKRSAAWGSTTHSPKRPHSGRTKTKQPITAYSSSFFSQTQ